MEIEGEDCSRIQLQAGSEAVFGRGSGFRSADRTVSRRHVLFRADDGRTEPARVSFEILGKNPVWVRSGGGGEVRVYRTFEKGELAAGDWLCASGRRPIWFAVKAIDGVRDLGSHSETEPESSYIPENDIDPVKEFGFLVIGHEFDRYPKQMLRKAKDWNWFLEEPTQDSNEDEDEDEKTKLKPGKRKKGKKARGRNGDEEDEDWTGESEEEKEDLVRPAKARKQMYSTRSKDRSLPFKRRTGGPGKSVQHRPSGSRGEDDAGEDEEDEEDETLGGFIVNDDDIEQEEEGEGDEEEEEEEFIEDEEED